jgi:3-hydroxymyristoyl/3-hydroxydecanoyl-(acyl carrier protein) dehydratase
MPAPVPARADRASPLAGPVPTISLPDGVAPNTPVAPTTAVANAFTVASDRTVDPDEPVLTGHFPGFPIFPGIALLEQAHQTVLHTPGNPTPDAGELLDLTAVRRARFQQPVFPGDLLRTVATLTGDRAAPQADVRIHRGDDGTAPAATFTLSYAHRPAGSHPVDIRSLLPHRYPMLLLDRVIEVVAGESLQAIKAVTINEPCYATLADDADQAYPPALMVESWCQAAGVLACLEQPNPDVRTGRVTLFGSITNLDLPGQAYPGDVLRHTVRLARLVSDAAVLEGETTVDGTTIMTVGGITIALRPAEALQRRPGS